MQDETAPRKRATTLDGGGSLWHHGCMSDRMAGRTATAEDTRTEDRRMAKHRRPRRLARRPGLEGLETRNLLTAFVVNSTGDDPNTVGTLRNAILQSNLGPGPNTITFNLPSGSVISPTAANGALPTIAKAVTIDATGGGSVPTIVLDGAAVGGAVNGLTINSSGVTIKGLAIGHFGGSGLVIEGPGGDTIGDDYIGTDITGKVAAPNTAAGIVVDSSNNTIGANAGRNVISGNTGVGIFLNGSAQAVNANLVAVNFIGVDSTGGKGLANNVGITLTNGTGNVFSNDVVSANTAGGIFFNTAGTAPATNGNVIQASLVGTDSTGELKLGNGTFGIRIAGQVGDKVGATGFANLNVVSNNAGSGIDLNGTKNTAVVDTLIGLDKAGTAAQGNTFDGILVENGATGTTIGGATADLGDFVSGNAGNGINIATGSTGTLIEAVHIGSDVSGLIGVPNGQYGVLFNQTSGRVLFDTILDNAQSGVLLFGSSGSAVQFSYIGDIASGTHGNASDGVFIYGSNNNSIGGPSAGNVISSNGQYGVAIEAGSQNNLVAGNFVGLNGAGQGGRGNSNGIAVFDSTGTTIGGTTAGSSNSIGSNFQYGIDIDGTGATGTAGTAGTFIFGNTVGVIPTSTAAAANNTGIILNGAKGVTIQQNVISANVVDGIFVLGGSGSTIRNNLIGTDGSGTKQLGNGADGIDISGAARITVGGTTTATLNLISANHGFGVQIRDPGATGNVVAGDWIGVDLTGLKALGNGEAGVFVDNVPGNTIGGSSGAYNVIGFNSNAGITVAGAGAAGTVIANNYVGLAVDGVTAAPNTIDGVDVQGTPGVDIAFNFISENADQGIHLMGGATATSIRGNFIGTDSTGFLSRGNGQAGILLDGTSGAVIGGTAGAATRNVISGNGQAGVFIFGPTGSGNVVEGNYIGTNKAGTGGLGNRVDGVLLQGPNNLIGGSGAAFNVISGNGLSGVHFLGGGTGNVVSGNWIGLDSTGHKALGNAFDGVLIDGTGVGNVSGNTIGSATAGSGNIIAGSGLVNVDIQGTAATGNVVLGNFIGTDVSGLNGVFATPYGITLNGAGRNTIGSTSGKGNLIAGSVSAGVGILNAGASQNLVVGNFIGRGQGSNVSLANNVGVLINNGANNTVGGTTSGASNTIVGNVTNTIQVTGSGATGNQTSGNVIGP